MDIENTANSNFYKKNIRNTSNDFSSFLIQVGKTYLGKPITKDEYKNIIKIIVNNLSINNKDDILDLGCGNGLMTNDIAKYAKHVTGFDLNEDLLTIAIENHQRDNIDYLQSNIMDIDFTQYSATKFYMYGVIQNIEYKILREFLQNILNTKKSFTLFIADIPDQARILNFYHTKERRDFLFKELIENKKSHLGNWWYKEHIIQICEDLDLAIEIRDQNPLLHTSHYRFDLVIKK